jgi:hypothetical protein
MPIMSELGCFADGGIFNFHALPRSSSIPVAAVHEQLMT